MEIINYVINILIGLFSGVYAGLIVARVAKFEELKNEAKRVVWGIDYVSINDSNPNVTSTTDRTIFSAISSELYYLRHSNAGDKINQLSNIIDHTMRRPPNYVDDMNKNYLTWQKIIRELRPDFKSIFTISRLAL
mgnify:FL=1